MCVLTLAHPGQLQARRIAEEAKVPVKFLEAILVELRNAGFVNSRRGTIGGHGLFGVDGGASGANVSENVFRSGLLA